MEAILPVVYQRKILKSGFRLDGRAQNEKREVFLNGDDSLSYSAIGKTIVVTKVSAKPQPIPPSIEVCVVRSTVSQESGKSTIDHSLQCLLDSICHKFISESNLEIAKPDPLNPFQSAVKVWGWSLIISQTIISDDGCVETAAVNGICMAISQLKLQEYNIDPDGQLVPANLTRSLSFPKISATGYCIIDGKLYTDPTSDELSIADGSCFVAIADSKLLKLITSGNFTLESWESVLIQ